MVNTEAYFVSDSSNAEKLQNELNPFKPNVLESKCICDLHLIVMLVIILMINACCSLS